MQLRFFCALVISITLSSQAAEVGAIERLLKHSIIDSNLPLAEVQAFTESRVPLVPEVKSLAEWEKLSSQWRRDTLDHVVFRGEAAQWRKAGTKVEWQETIAGGPGYHIRKLRYEALPGFWIPAVLYEPDHLTGKVPAVMNVNGHEGIGKVAEYKQIRCINQAKRGMLALNPEWIGMGQLRDPGYQHYKMNQLDLCGTSGVSPFYLAMSRGLDILLSHPNADPERIAVAGLSGGGWQTIFISSLDPRVKLCNPVAGYSSFRTRARFVEDLGDSEQTPCDLATVADYAHLTAMLAPRPALLTFNAKDNCCFGADHALEPLWNAAAPVYRLYGKEAALRSHVNYVPGTHNFGPDNRQALYRILGDFFYAPDAGFSALEIPCDDELKTNGQLQVELPADNATFNSLARALASKLPRDPEIPEKASALERWQKKRRAQLRELVHAKDYAVTAEEAGHEAIDGVKAVFWKLKMDGVWTVPAVELIPDNPGETAVLVADAGRASASAQAAELLKEGKRVLAVDPFYFGESQIRSRDFLYALLVGAVGERPLGLQASQLTAIARWSRMRNPGNGVSLVAAGPRSSLFALTAAALEEKAIGAVTLHQPLQSLKEIIEQDWAMNEKPELFCFGLLEHFDVPQLRALVSPRPLAE